MLTNKSIKPIHRKGQSLQLTSSKANVFTFPKASRFPYSKENDDPQILLLPSTLSKKSCTFGLGKRWEPRSSHCRDSPSPTQYSLKGSFGGANHILDYKKQTVKERKLFYIKPVPGPGSYNPNTPKRRRSPSCLILGKKHLRSMSVTPDPASYNPNYEAFAKNVAVNFSFYKARKEDFWKSQDYSGFRRTNSSKII